MTRTPPDTPFTVTLDDPPVCGVSDRMERHIRLQFAAVVVTVAAIIGVGVAILARAR